MTDTQWIVACLVAVAALVTFGLISEDRRRNR